MALPPEYSALQTLATLIQQLKLTRTAQILERLRGTEYENILQHIHLTLQDSEDWTQTTDDDERAFTDGVNKLIMAMKNTQINELSETAKQRPLTRAEEELLHHLLAR